MGDQKNDRLFLMSLSTPSSASLFPTPPSSVLDYSYSQQRSPGQTILCSSGLLRDRDVVEQYSNDDGSSLHVCTNDQYPDIPASLPLGATMGNEGAHGSWVESQAISNDNADPSLSQQLELQLEGQLSEQGRAPLLHDSVGVSGPPNSQRSPDVLIVTFADANDELSPLAPQDDTYYEGQTFYQQLESRPRVVHAGRKRVHCTFPGCLKFIRKDGLTRHMNEIHLRIVKGVCTHCGKGFRRPYLKVQHEATCHG